MRFLLVCCLLSSAAVGYRLTSHESSVSSLVTKNGYPFEEHEVVTEDGYILALHRIPHGKRTPGRVGRPVLLQHGLLCSSACWVVSRPDKGLGYILADEGYDVWMLNSRGNIYSRKHQKLDPDKEPDATRYWDFSFHEMGYYDLPASIDYILKLTQYKRLHYVGHSQGTSLFFVLASSRTAYNQKIAHMTAMAPIVFLDHMRGTVHELLHVAREIEFLARVAKVHEFLGDSRLAHWYEKIFCMKITYSKLVCDNILFLIAGYDSKQLNDTLLYVITEYLPAGTSVKQLIHYAQLAKSDKFRQFDYGKYKNLEVYHRDDPPEYNLSQISVPVALHYSENDWLSGVKDVVRLNSSLSNSTSLLVPYKEFNHVDFMWAIDVCKLLYNDVIRIMSRY